MSRDSVAIENRSLALVEAARYARKHPSLVALVSLLVLVPCFWHTRIAAGDLASHTYNAWIAQLASDGKAPGIEIHRQYDNVLFDLMLFYGAKLMGLRAAEKAAVALAVLVFFWGTFALVAAMARRVPWVLAPFFAVLAYGYSFNMGFLNYYLSVGLGSAALAMVWRGGRGNWLLAAALSPVVLAAHPIGFLWAAGTAAYLVLWRRLPEYWRLGLPAAVIGALMGLRSYISNREQYDASWPAGSFLLRNGADQMILYGQRYGWLAYSTAAFAAVCFLVLLVGRRKDREADWGPLRLSAEFYLVALLATALLPENLRSGLYAGWIGLLVSRLTTVSAIFALAVLASLEPRKKWILAGAGAAALGYFGFLYQDTRTLNRLEANAERVLAGLPYGTRIVPVLNAPEDWRVPFLGHAVERAAIGRCFSVSNYEPSSGQFRLRAREGSPVVTASSNISESMASGDYVVRPGDLPLTAVVQCGPDLTGLCAAPLAAGMKTEEAPDPD